MNFSNLALLYAVIAQNVVMSQHFDESIIEADFYGSGILKNPCLCVKMDGTRLRSELQQWWGMKE